jgi:hypothetical protein
MVPSFETAPAVRRRDGGASNQGDAPISIGAYDLPWRADGTGFARPNRKWYAKRFSEGKLIITATYKTGCDSCGFSELASRSVCMLVSPAVHAEHVSKKIDGGNLIFLIDFPCSACSDCGIGLANC